MDCTKALDYGRERMRMCNCYQCDEECPLYKYDCCSVIDEESIQIVQKWSDEHQYMGQDKYKTASDDVFEESILKLLEDYEYEKVVHAHWICDKKFSDLVQDDVYICSKCGSTSIGEQTRYCPYCGARMDEVYDS